MDVHFFFLRTLVAAQSTMWLRPVLLINLNENSDGTGTFDGKQEWIPSKQVWLWDRFFSDL